MKNLYRVICFLTLTLIISTQVSAQSPSYALTAQNIQYYGCPSNILEFDIYIRSTDPSVTFLYCSGQYMFDFNSAIANGGTLSYKIVGSDLPNYLINPTTQVSGSELRLSAVVPSGPENSIAVPTSEPGLRVVRMRLSTTASSFASVDLNLSWRGPAQGGFYTKIFSYDGSLAEDVSNYSGHSLSNTASSTCETFLLSRPSFNASSSALPVTLSWFKASIASFYKILVSSDENFSTLVYSDSGIVDTFKTVGGLDPSTRYYWKVMANNGTDYYATSQTWYFNTGFINNSQSPTYNLTARNFVTGTNQVDFDIYIEHTNPPASFEYAMGQYFLNFNPAIANGGTLTYEMVSSPLPGIFRPINPTILNGNILGLAANSPPGAGFGLNLTNNGNPGTRIATMRLKTSAAEFSSEPLNLSWRNGSGFGYFTQIYAYVGSTPTDVTTEITTAGTHSIYFSFPQNSVAAEIKVLLEAFYNTGSGKMNMSDTVTAYLRSTTAPFEIVDVAKSVIDATTFTGSFLFANAPTGTYYIQLNHRNSIETWSRSGGETYTAGSSMHYDFTTDASKAFGNNLRNVGSNKWAVISCDVNQSGNVNLTDVIKVNNDGVGFLTGYLTSDVNGDGMVNLTDVVFAYNNSSFFVTKVTP